MPRSTRRSVNDMPVMAAKCGTCPFGPDGDHGVQAAVISKLLEASQECHSTGWPRATHLCRGARDWQLQIMYRMGLLPEPTDQAWAAVWASMKSRWARQEGLRA